MDPNSGRLYSSMDEATAADVQNAVEMFGRPEDILQVSKAVRAQAKAKRKAQKKARKANR